MKRLDRANKENDRRNYAMYKAHLQPKSQRPISVRFTPNRIAEMQRGSPQATGLSPAAVVRCMRRVSDGL
jgi:hypothetical protein